MYGVRSTTRNNQDLAKEMSQKYHYIMLPYEYSTAQFWDPGRTIVFVRAVFEMMMRSPTTDTKSDHRLSDQPNIGQQQGACLLCNRLGVRKVVNMLHNRYSWEWAANSSSVDLSMKIYLIQFTRSAKSAAHGTVLWSKILPRNRALVIVHLIFDWWATKIIPDHTR